MDWDDIAPTDRELDTLCGELLGRKMPNAVDVVRRFKLTRDVADGMQVRQWLATFQLPPLETYLAARSINDQAHTVCLGCGNANTSAIFTFEDRVVIRCDKCRQEWLVLIGANAPATFTIQPIKP